MAWLGADTSMAVESNAAAAASVVSLRISYSVSCVVAPWVVRENLPTP